MNTKNEAMKMVLEALEGADIIDCDMRDAIVVIKKVLAQPEQEPVAWLDEYGNTFPLAAKQYSVVGKHWKPLYTSPPQRTWVGLTDVEILAVNMSTVTKLIDEPIVCDTDHNIIQLGKAIEAKLKDKNTKEQE